MLHSVNIMHNVLYAAKFRVTVQTVNVRLQESIYGRSSLVTQQQHAHNACTENVYCTGRMTKGIPVVPSHCVGVDWWQQQLVKASKR